ncbi:MAG TPA: nucleoside-diphosphate sugar epimerase/dehydratase [Stellaceae bacterium]|nr:nucleoside-diphosphate sugar epimerase/dehydratase [Stellaceae bacterium]
MPRPAGMRRDGGADFPGGGDFAIEEPVARNRWLLRRVPLLPKSRRAWLAFAHDVAMAGLSFALALYLRLGESVLNAEPRLTLAYGIAFTATAAAVFLVTGLYRGIWRYASLPDLFNIARAATLIELIFLPVMFLFTRLDTLPRSFLLIDWLVLVVLLGAPRLGYRLFKDRGLDHLLERGRSARVPVLLISTKDGADTFIRETVRDRNAVYRVVGMLSDTPSRVGREIYGVPVLGTIDALERVVALLDRRGRRPQKLVITTHGMTGEEVRKLLDRADALAIPLARLPRLTPFEQARPDAPRAVEPIALEDLLGRPQAVLDREAMARLIQGRRILVTGAGGTIGSELTRQIAALGPARLILVDNSEFLLYAIDGELRERWPDLAIRPLLGDVRERRRIETVMTGEQPQIVFHAAALKHVPMVENNPVEGVLTNIVGSRNVAEAARAHGAALVVMISTDKAVDPASVMGASKRLAEAFCQALDLYEARRVPAPGTRFVTVRFGNVLGSTGSVVPLFARQLAAGGPLTVTDPEVSRYFMTVREAVELVLEASASAPAAAGGDARGKIFVLDMGEPVRIVDLARQMIRLAGLRPERDIAIVYSGLRPGEKLHEALFHAAEAPVPTAHPALLLAAPRTADYAVLARAIDELEEQARAGHAERALDLLRRIVPEYRAAVRGQEPPAAAAGSD